MVDQPHGRPAVADRHRQRILAQDALQPLGHRPADDLHRGQILDGGEVEPAFVSWDVGDVSAPDRIGRNGFEVAVKQIGRDRSRLLSRRSCANSAASAFCAAVAAAEPAASSSSRQVFNCVGVTPSSAATLLYVAPGSDSRATDCSLYSGENRRLVCFVILSLQVGI